MAPRDEGTSIDPSFFRRSVLRKDVQTSKVWLEEKAKDDLYGHDKNLWRIHDKLYDLTEFVKRQSGQI